MPRSDLALVAGLADTRRTLRDWGDRPGQVLWAWTWRALAVTAVLLAAVGIVATLSTPDTVPVRLPGLNAPADGAAVLEVLRRNALVLALHSSACLAGFIAGSSLPLEAAARTGAWRRVHELAGPAAIAFVVAATSFSLITQAYVLGNAASTLADQGAIGPWLLLVGLLPHALPELTALFLPLAAWLAASRSGAWDELLAATVVTTTLAVPVLVAAAVVEVHVSPHLILALRG